MWNLFVSHFNKFFLGEVHNSNTIYRDELSKKHKPASPKRKMEEKEAIRVKVMMTKKEANRLLSKCKDGGVLEFKDVARELVQIPVNRVSVVSPTAGLDGTLKSIPEDF